MPVRIVTWNVNGIRNPFKYSPWNKDRSLKVRCHEATKKRGHENLMMDDAECRNRRYSVAMFDILEADIVCFQEVKTPKASLTDDLVFVDGWDTFYSFPHSLTGYSGVAVYTRDSKCVPLRVEEGVTGVLKIPGTQTRYLDASPDKQIGGYPTDRQLRRAAVPRDIIDSEGRCLILEFSLFVLINVYCPARRNHERTGYRNTFLLALDVRIRNLAAAGKNVVLCGDLNIMRDQLDTAGIWGHGGHKVLTEALEFDEGYMTMRAPKLLSQLLFNSRTISDTGAPFIDEATETRRPPVLYDTGRELHPYRTGMFTCWDTRKNHRPANFGSRIDLIMCSPKVMQLVQEADIQPHLHGSDHCPVYAVLQETISDSDSDGETTGPKDTVHILDYLNPPGRFVGGQNVLPADEDAALLKKRFPQSGRRMAQFSNRANIASMFQRASKPVIVPATAVQKSSASPAAADASAQPSTPELPALFKAEAVELVESDYEGDDGGAGMIEDEEDEDDDNDNMEDVDGGPGTVEEDERSEYVAGSTVSTTSKLQQPTDLPEARIKDSEDRGSQPPPLHASTDPLSSVVPSIVSPPTPSRPPPLTSSQTSQSASGNDVAAADEIQSGGGRGRGGQGDLGVSETSAVHGCRAQTPSTDLPFERGTEVFEENTSEPNPNQIQSFWGDRSGVDVSRERENSAGEYGETREPGESGVALAPPPPPKPKTALPASQSSTPSLLSSSTTSTATGTRRSLARSQSGAASNTLSSNNNNNNSSSSSLSSARPAKKAKTSASSSSAPSTGIQMSMNMFLTARPAKEEKKQQQPPPPPVMGSTPAPQPSPSPSTAVASALDEANTASAAANNEVAAEWMTAEEIDAAFKNLDAAKASWSRLGLGQRQGPLCEHGEPCKTFVTKKAGVNSGRSFYMCARPPGPLGKKEKGTAWQCTTFVWCRDWRPDRE